MEREQKLENKGRSPGTRTHACRRRKMTDQRRRRCGRERASVDAEMNGDGKKRERLKRREQEGRERRRRRQLWRLGFLFSSTMVQISSISCGCIFIRLLVVVVHFIGCAFQGGSNHMRQQPGWGRVLEIPPPPPPQLPMHPGIKVNCKNTTNT